MRFHRDKWGGEFEEFLSGGGGVCGEKNVLRKRVRLQMGL